MDVAQDKGTFAMGRRITDIEILRAIAVVLVVVHHALGNLLTWPEVTHSWFYTYIGGWVGVDLFFAISGFVIAREFIPKLQRSGTQERAIRETLAFWTRRAWRLWPSAWLWLAVMLVASAAFNQSGVFGTIKTNVEATVVGVLQLANFRHAESLFNWHYGASFVYWSLSLEEQFYLLLPFVVLMTRRWLPYVLAVLVLGQFFVERTALLMYLRTDAIALGVLLAIWSQHSSYQWCRPESLLRWRSGTLVMLCLLALMLALGADLKTVSFRVGVIAVLSAVLVWMASYDRDYLLAKGRLKQALVWLGSRSYAIYLIHIPVFFAVREWHHRSNGGQVPDASDFWPFVIVSSALILLLSEMNYRFIEMPLRRKGALISQRMIASETAPTEAAPVSAEVAPRA